MKTNEDSLKTTDDALITLYLSGNEEALNILFSRYIKTILKNINNYVHNKDLAKDLAQETFIKALTAISSGKYVENNKFSAWLGIMARNLTMDYLRKMSQPKNKTVIYLEDYDSDCLRIPCKQETLEDKETKEMVKRAIVRLPKEQREVLILRYFDENKFKDIAIIQNTCLNTTMGRYRYAMKNLRKTVLP